MDTAELKSYIDMRLADQQKANDERFAELQAEIDRRFAAMTDAVSRSEGDINRRLDAVNEFRLQQAAQFIMRSEFMAAKDQALQGIKVSHEKIETMITRAEFAAIQRLVYIGLGGVLAFEIVLKFLGK